MCKKLWKLMHFFKWLFFRLHCLFIFDRFFSNVRNIGCFKKIILLYYIYTDKKGYWNPNYSRVPNKRTGCLLENEKKNPTYMYLFRPIHLSFFVHTFTVQFHYLLNLFYLAHFDLRWHQKPLWGHNWESQSNINQL